jgi:hypothetical protein
VHVPLACFTLIYFFLRFSRIVSACINDFAIIMELGRLAACFSGSKEVVMAEFWHDLIPNGWVITRIGASFNILVRNVPFAGS